MKHILITIMSFSLVILLSCCGIFRVGAQHEYKWNDSITYPEFIKQLNATVDKVLKKEHDTIQIFMETENLRVTKEELSQRCFYPVYSIYAPSYFTYDNPNLKGNNNIIISLDPTELHMVYVIVEEENRYIHMTYELEKNQKIQSIASSNDINGDMSEGIYHILKSEHADAVVCVCENMEVIFVRIKNKFQMYVYENGQYKVVEYADYIKKLTQMDIDILLSNSYYYKKKQIIVW